GGGGEGGGGGGERGAGLRGGRGAGGGEDSVPLFRRLADVYRDRLDKPAAAIEVLRRVVAGEPNHVASLVALGDLHALVSAWPEAVAAYGRAVAGGADPPALPPLPPHLPPTSDHPPR